VFVLRRILSAVVAVTAVVAAYGCGSSGSDTSVGTKAGDHRQALVPADDSTTAGGVRTVTYRDVQFDVPADWPVYDLDADPTTCVRFDVNAVYLGHPGEDMSCPAGLVGRADAVLVEPTDDSAHTNQRQDDAEVGVASADVMASTSSGLEVQVAGDGAAASEVVASIPSAGLDVTLPYQDSDSTAQQILHSFRAVAR
jgi:hypothetical protein